tara:strand:- start:476 stop:907 length:432 start_codon:yes stop_codon:yes gene_type:complete
MTLTTNATYINGDWEFSNFEVSEFKHSVMLSVFTNRDEHILYKRISPRKTLCVAYKFAEDSTYLGIPVIYGASIITHVKGSPPKVNLRSTARARLAKCPVYVRIDPKDFGVGLEHGKAELRRNVFEWVQRKYGIRGTRLKIES